MKEVIKFLSENIDGALATSYEGKPYVRPWQFMFGKNGKIWFCTANIKEVFRQLQVNPSIEFVSTSINYVTVRIRGEIKFSSDMEIKKKIIELSPLVKSIYNTADNPILEIFYLEHGTAIMSDFSGNPPQVFNF